MNNKELLRPFDLAQAEAGAAVCWSYLDDPVAFVGRCANSDIAVRRDDGIIETPCEFSLRMKPLFWKDGQPVYVGDSLWHTISKRTLIVNRLQEGAEAEEYGFFYDTQGSRARADLCLFKAPPQPFFMLEGKPVNQGDRLWHTRDNLWVTVMGMGMFPSGDFIDEAGGGRSPRYCTWEKPKTTVVRYANVYNVLDNLPCIGEMFPTPDGPKGVRGSEKPLGIARIEWEE